MLPSNNITGAHIICGGVEFCSQISPALVSSSATVRLMSTDILESTLLMLTSNNITSVMVVASWHELVSLPITGPHSK